jgi:hypothetical protein
MAGSLVSEFLRIVVFCARYDNGIGGQSGEEY